MWFDVSGYSPRAGHFVAVFDVITERKRHEAQLEHLANFDPVTLLPNRLMASASAEHAIARAKRRAGSVAILFLDLDNFKHVNDSFGHLAGDQLLREAAARLKGRVRGEDTLARMGGDELVVVMESLSREGDAAVLAQGLNEVLRAPFRVDGRDLFVTASIGLALYPEEGEGIDTLLSHADAALYRAKEEGRDRFCFYTPELTVRATEPLLMEADLRKAIERQEFVLHYQPLLDLGTDTLMGVEALVRWQHPEKGLVPPLDFIPLEAETAARCAQIRQSVEDSISDYDREKLQERLAGGATQIEVKERKDRIVDTTHTTRAAVEEGGSGRHYPVRPNDAPLAQCECPLHQ